MGGRAGANIFNEVAIGPVTGRTLYSYRSGSHVLFYVYSRACHFFCPPLFCGVVHSVCDRILVFHIQLFMERLHHDHMIVKLSAYEMQRTR